jgi:hypothetical protein|tara:strand:+ start:585 stop:857 length:273 start_codon:yes stop_codon:yes gene_type:complete
MPEQMSLLMKRFDKANDEFDKKFPRFGERVTDGQMQDQYGLSKTAAKLVRTAINTRNEIRDERSKKDPEYKRLNSLINRYADILSEFNNP